ncbi:MAG: class I SAM-dependent methyltransferase [Myxococcota bacterium]|nr:class I SAM-dependent methyltransferase [Myxococcota bacterium]
MRGVEQIPWVYDAMCSLMEATGLRKWRAWLTGGARGLTLEVGSGTGRNLPLYPQEARVVAVEPSWDTLRRSRARAGAQVALVRASAEALPFRDGAFETVVSGLVFCSVPDPVRGLEEVRRVLQDDGQLRMLEHVRSTSRFGAAYQDLIQPAWTRVAGGCHPNRDTEANVTAAGLRIDPLTRRAKGNLRRFVASKR